MAISLPRRRAITFGAIFVVGGALVLAAIGILSGVYNVAASVRHFDITDRLIKLALRRSIDTHSLLIDVPDLDRPGLVRLGARHFANGCQSCHAAPGVRQNPIVQGMYPAAPALEDKIDDWQDKELFWIVRHGLKFTGMPQWVGEGRDDEVWALVAFLRALPEMTAQTYAELAGASQAGAGFVLSLDQEQLVAQCASCHGNEESGPVSDIVPSLNGQKPQYLIRALEEYASDLRQSGMMEPVAAALSADQMALAAASFASMVRPAAATDASAQGVKDTDPGQRIAREGVPRQNVPACASCHGQGSARDFPDLSGLSEVYLATQLHLFRQGVRGQSPQGQIMRRVAERLTDQQIADVAAYLSDQDRALPSSVTASTEPLP